MKLDVNNWKPFALGNKKYFKIERIRNPLTLSDYKFSWNKSDSTFPVISSSGINNGTVNFVVEDKEWLNKGKVITIAKDGSIGSCFYQLSNFYANSHIFILQLVEKEMNEFLAFFLCSIISLEKFKYSFGRAWILKDVLKTKILLPQDEKGDPDWLWMESYSKKIFSKVKEDIIRLIDIEKEKKAVNIFPDSWKEFPIDGYFCTSGTKTTKKEDVEPGEFAYISNKNTFNGYESSSYISTEKGNVITVNDFGANFSGSFYQEKEFAATYHIQKIWPKNKSLNKHVALFLTTILNFGTDKYSYGRIRNLKVLRREKIFLPSNNQNNLDWNYMEIAIKQKWGEIADKFKKELEKLNW